MTPHHTARIVSRAHAAATLELALHATMEDPEMILCLEKAMTEQEIIDELALHFLNKAVISYDRHHHPRA